MKSPVPRPKIWRFDRLITEHAFDKLRHIDCTFAEFDAVLARSTVIEETVISEGNVKELILMIDWIRPLHAVVVVDGRREEERIVTVYEPHDDLWDEGYRVRR